MGVLLVECFQVSQVTSSGSRLCFGQHTKPGCEAQSSQSHCRARCFWRGTSASPCRRPETAWRVSPGQGEARTTLRHPLASQPDKKQQDVYPGISQTCVALCGCPTVPNDCRRITRACLLCWGTNSFGLGGHPWSGSREFCSCPLCRES